ncbi:BAL_1a_G0012090.mRNA.1.CDS.1 [Saccharomyces cerevisiae]|nr:BAL_1a_G0012090.mRNA.1.CDS.1 [Saccharomyces cerevisiae]CAI7082190.1 BAL_1a_G0012090.mRNA.1.CDS.1 [Saccharomyces cerevisiae]
MISRPELESWLMTTVGMSPMPERSGVSVQTVTVQTWLLTKLRPSNTCTKSRIPLLLLSNGLPRKVQFSVKK